MKIEFFAHPQYAWDLIGICRVWKNYWHIHILCFTISLSFKRRGK